MITHFSAAVNKCINGSCQIYSGFRVPKILAISSFLTELFNKIKNERRFLNISTTELNNELVNKFDLGLKLERVTSDGECEQK